MTTFINKDKLFLDENTFKSMVPSSRNVSDTQTIYYNIALSQTQTLKTIMGRDFYDDMVVQYTLYADSGVSMEEHYSYLFENFLLPILSFSTYKRLISSLSYRLKEDGLRAALTSSSELASPEDRGFIISEITNDINNFIADMKHYIFDNRSYFPLYKGHLDGDDKNPVSFGIGKVEKRRNNIYTEGKSIYTQNRDWTTYYKK
jgi:hypothetical protein